MLIEGQKKLHEEFFLEKDLIGKETNSQITFEFNY